MTWLSVPARARLQALVLFLVLAGLVLALANDYKATRAANLKDSRFAQVAQTLTHEVESLIGEKRNATLAIALALSHDDRLIQQLRTGAAEHRKLQDLSLAFRSRTDYKNVWIQLLDAEGRVLRQYRVTGAAGTTAESWEHVKDFVYGADGLVATRTRTGVE